MSKLTLLECDEIKLEYLKYRIDKVYNIIKLIVSAILIATCGILTNHYVFAKMSENTSMIYFVIAINAIVVLLLLGVSIDNILTLLGKAKLIKNNGVGIPKNNEDS